MAKSVKALITPEVLRWARERRIRLELDDAAKRLKVKPTQLADWEAGADLPTFTQLKRIANTYKTHVSVFYLPEPPTGFKLLADHRRLPKSATTDEEQAHKDQAYRLNANIIEAYERRETLIELYELLEEFPSEVTLELAESDDRENAAQEIRDFLQLDTRQLQRCNDDRSALRFWRERLEAKGILVCQTSVNSHLSIALETVRGFCIAQKPFPMIVLNPKDSPYGRVFTIVHELVHIGLGKSVIQNSGLSQFLGRETPTEAFCNEVAGGVLIPKGDLADVVNLQSLEADLPKLSKHFHVSRSAIMARLRSLSIISQPTYEAYIKREKEKYRDRKSTGGPIPYHTRLLNTAGVHFARTAFTAYHEQKITLADLAASFSYCDLKHLPKIEGVIFA